MRFTSSLGAVLLPCTASLVSAIQFNPDDAASIRDVTKEYAFGLMSHYVNNASGLPAEEIGIFPKPHYWWAAGAAWGGMIEYSQFTGDASYVSTLTQALVSNYGPNNDIILPWRKDQEGNDDQAFWGLAVMSAVEYQFPDPAQKAPATYLQVVENCFNNIVSRWAADTCGGGLKWQIYPENDYGYTYKNSISNGAAFALGARLARYTGNQTYADWATKIFDWTKEVGLISDKYEVYDGADELKACKEMDHTQWTYNIGMYLHGSSVMYNFTDGDAAWKRHTNGFVEQSAAFFGPYENATDIMYEVACETGETGRHCNLDQQSFKAYLSRSMGKTALMAPFTRERITKWLKKSAVSAAKSCTGGATGKECGSKWYTGNWDGTTGTGQQLAALEVTQALLMLEEGIVPSIQGENNPEPQPQPVPIPSSSAAPEARSTSVSKEVPSAPATPPATTLATSAAAQAPEPTPNPPVTDDKKPCTTSIPTSSPVVPSAPIPSEPASSLPAPSEPVTSKLPVNTPVTPGVCTCTPTSTVTVWVPPPVPTTASPIVPAPPSIETIIPILPPNGTVPVPPPANSTGPIEFTGAASSLQTTSYAVIGAVTLAIIGGLL